MQAADRAVGSSSPFSQNLQRPFVPVCETVGRRIPAKLQCRQWVESGLPVSLSDLFAEVFTHLGVNALEEMNLTTSSPTAVPGVMTLK